MRRDLSLLASRPFDLLVIGGGIYGLAAAYDAAQRGLEVALVDQSDFGAATSFNHLKTLHGGLRYLQSADFARMRESNRERQTFARIAPRFVAPLPFVMATSGSPTRNPLALRAAFTIDSLLTGDRHDLPRGEIVPASRVRDLLGNLTPVGLRSAALWYDRQTLDGVRLTFAFALAAANHGATLANYVRALKVRRDESKRVVGARVQDVFTGNEFNITARTVLNAAGPWAWMLIKDTHSEPEWPLLKAMNLVTSRPAPKAALIASSEGGRALVLLPWQGRIIIGTSESATQQNPDDQDARRNEVMAFLHEVNSTFRELKLKFDEITLVHRGIVAGRKTARGLTLLGHSRIIDHQDGSMSVVGVKYTTARAVAERAIDQVMEKLGKPATPSRTAVTVLPGAGLEDKDPSDRVTHAIREEMAQTLIDVVVRRTGIGAAAHPGTQVANQYADAMQRELGWPEERKQREIAALKRFYDITG